MDNYKGNYNNNKSNNNSALATITIKWQQPQSTFQWNKQKKNGHIKNKQTNKQTNKKNNVNNNYNHRKTNKNMIKQHDQSKYIK